MVVLRFAVLALAAVIGTLVHQGFFVIFRGAVGAHFVVEFFGHLTSLFTVVVHPRQYYHVLFVAILKLINLEWEANCGLREHIELIIFVLHLGCSAASSALFPQCILSLGAVWRHAAASILLIPLPPAHMLCFLILHRALFHAGDSDLGGVWRLLGQFGGALALDGGEAAAVVFAVDGVVYCSLLITPCAEEVTTREKLQVGRVGSHLVLHLHPGVVLGALVLLAVGLGFVQDGRVTHLRLISSNLQYQLATSQFSLLRLTILQLPLIHGVELVLGDGAFAFDVEIPFFGVGVGLHACLGGVGGLLVVVGGGGGLVGARLH